MEASELFRKGFFMASGCPDGLCDVRNHFRRYGNDFVEAAREAC